MSNYYIGSMSFDSNYLKHYGVPGMEWGEHKKKKDYALDQANLDRRKAMRDQQTDYTDRHEQQVAAWSMGKQNGQGQKKINNKMNLMSQSSTKVGSDAQLAATSAGKKYLNAVRKGVEDGDLHYDRKDGTLSGSSRAWDQVDKNGSASDLINKQNASLYAHSRKRVTQESKAADARKRAAANKRKSHGAKTID